ncbi:MAG: hypothetical protein IPG81_33555 [Sandaracinaceae bacterium]|nr:hypothetical protein [Sandaracinaceae bacterium]
MGRSSRAWRTLSALAVVTALGGVLLPGCATPRAAGSASATPATPRTRVLGSGPRVLLAQVLLPPGARFTLPTSVCQDVLVYVRHGATELDGGRPLLPGRAVRFSLDGAALRKHQRAGRRGLCDREPQRGAPLRARRHAGHAAGSRGPGLR